MEQMQEVRPANDGHAHRQGNLVALYRLRCEADTKTRGRIFSNCGVHGAVGGLGCLAALSTSTPLPLGWPRFAFAAASGGALASCSFGAASTMGSDTRPMPSSSQTLQLAEVLGALSLARTWPTATPWRPRCAPACSRWSWRGRREASEQEIADAYDAAMLRYLGCTAYAPEEAAALGDDIAAKQLYAPVDFGRKSEPLPTTLKGLGKGVRAAEARTGGGGGPGGALGTSRLHGPQHLRGRRRLASAAGHGRGSDGSAWPDLRALGWEGAPRGVGEETPSASPRASCTWPARRRFTTGSVVWRPLARWCGAAAAATSTRGWPSPLGGAAPGAAWESWRRPSVWDAVLAAEPRAGPRRARGGWRMWPGRSRISWT